MTGGLWLLLGHMGVREGTLEGTSMTRRRDDGCSKWCPWAKATIHCLLQVKGTAAKVVLEGRAISRRCPPPPAHTLGPLTADSPSWLLQ